MLTQIPKYKNQMPLRSLLQTLIMNFSIVEQSLIFILRKIFALFATILLPFLFLLLQAFLQAFLKNFYLFLISKGWIVHHFIWKKNETALKELDSSEDLRMLQEVFLLVCFIWFKTPTFSCYSKLSKLT